MWPALVISLLTAIFAWIWYTKEPVQQPEEAAEPQGAAESEQERSVESKHGPLAAHQAAGESKPIAGPDRYEPNPSKQDVPCLRVQEEKAASSETFQVRTDQQNEVWEKGLSDAEPLERQSTAAANVNLLNVQDEVIVADQFSAAPTNAELQADLQEHPTVIPKKDAGQANGQEPLTDIPESETELSILGQQTSASVQETCSSEEHLKDPVQTSADEGYKQVSKNEVLCKVDDVHPSDVPEVSEIIEGEVHSPLKEEQLAVEEVHSPVTVVLEASEVLMANEHRAQISLDDSCRASMSVQENGQVEVLHSRNSQDGVYGNEKATGCPSENSLVLKNEAMDLLKAKGHLNPDLYLEMVNTSGYVGNAVANQSMKHEPIEECDIESSVGSDPIKPPTGLQDTDFTSGSNESSDGRMSSVQKLGAGPESSQANIYNLMLNQEKEMADLGSSEADEKTTLGSSSEANIHDIDHQKTRKIATIQPMPQNVNFAFKVHYITHSDSQMIAVTGDHEKLGKWETYVPLTSGNGGFWSHLITLPADTNLSWKLVMVENGKIKRWEECNNRSLKTAHEDIDVQLSWGYP